MTKQQILIRLKGMRSALIDNGPFAGRAEALAKIESTIEQLETYRYDGSSVPGLLKKAREKEFLELHGCRENITPEEYFERINTKLIRELAAPGFEEVATLLRDING